MYKDISGYEGLYRVSDTGEVFSIRAGRVLKPIVGNMGYVYVHLCKGKNGTKVKRLHRLVAEAFIPNPLKLPQVNHIDGDKSNNAVSNLEWCTGLDNMRHSIVTGLRNLNGDKNPSAKLSAEEVLEIRAKYVRGSKDFGTVALAREYGVTDVMIGKIVRGECWKEGFDPQRSNERAENDI